MRQSASGDRPAVPAITVERLQACVAEYGGQLAPGHHQFNPRVQVALDGTTQSVLTEDIPEMTSDFGACTRVALRDMATPDGLLNMRRAEATAAQRSYLGSPAVAVVVAVGLTELVFEAGAHTILFAVSVELVDRASKDIAEALRRRRKEKDKCRDQYVDCMATYVAREDGNQWKQTRCGACLLVCSNQGSWPSRVGNGSCEYWQRDWH